MTELTLDAAGVPWITVAETDWEGRFISSTLYRRQVAAWEELGVAAPAAPLTRAPDGAVWQCVGGIVTRHGEAVAALPEIAPAAPCTVIGDAAGQVWVTDHTTVWQLVTRP